ncbi:hypothetical protein Y032_0012g1682 [Ancylostoma ceylanicum]|uniref:Uncharacterized protein n=1 Tax=Ancylostoma ceylanicum TaxID=53326 RepID=A0A016VCV4_9BILA|nr:hypothetical protein Y032_0012g1682 [Ancylostoma ceylanicum]
MAPSHSVVYFPLTKDSDVVDINDLTGDSSIGSNVKVRWHGKLYSAKVLFKGSKTACETAVKEVTFEGTIPERFFLIGDGTHSRPAPSRTDESSCPSLEQTVKEGFSEIMERIKHVGATTASRSSDFETRSTLRRLEMRLDSLYAIVEEIRANIPKPILADAIDFNIMSQERVESLLAAKCGSMNKFALALEKDVFADNSRDLALNIDDRIESGHKITFIRQCIMKYFQVAPPAQESMWRSVKAVLNGRARKTRGRSELQRDELFSTPSPSEDHFDGSEE